MVKAIQAGTVTETPPTPADPTVTVLNTLSLTKKEMLQCIQKLKSNNGSSATNQNHNFICYRCNQQGHTSKKCPNSLPDETYNNNTNSKNEWMSQEKILHQLLIIKKRRTTKKKLLMIHKLKSF